MDSPSRALEWIAPVALIITGLILGGVLRRIAATWLDRAALTQGMTIYYRVVASLRRVILLWGLVAGVYAAALSLPPPPQLMEPLLKILTVVILSSATYVVGRVAGDLIELHASKVTHRLGRAGTPATMSLLANIAVLVVFAVGLLIILSSLGIAISPLLTALGVGGLAVALALRDVLANIFSGLEIIASHNVRPGDYIRLDSGDEGSVMDINWRNTTIRDMTNNLIIVPNEKLAAAVIRNYHLPEKDIFTLSIDVPISQDNDLDRAEEGALDVARDVLNDLEGKNGGHAPFVRFSSMGNGTINLSTFLQARDYLDGSLARHEFIKRLHRRFAELGVKLPPP